MAFPDSWPKYALISITRSGGSAVEYMSVVSEIEINEGDAPGESIATVAGGRIWSDKPMEDGEVNLTLYPVEMDTTSAAGGFFQQFHMIGAGAYDTSEPLSTLQFAGETTPFGTLTAGTSRVRDKFRVAILVTNDTAAATAAGATATATDSVRFAVQDCRIISHKANNSDDVWKVTATFKYPAFNKAGTKKNSTWQSGDQTALVALATYS